MKGQVLQVNGSRFVAGGSGVGLRLWNPGFVSSLKTLGLRGRM